MSSNELRISYGGQAIIEGVMMRGRNAAAIAVRHPAGHVLLRSIALDPRRLSQRLRPIPFVRGAVALWDMLALGMRALNFSANVQLDEPAEPDEPADGSQDSASQPRADAAADPKASATAGSAGSAADGVMTGSLIVGAAIGVGLFLVLPLVLTSLTDDLVESDVMSNLLEGAVRMAIFVAYIALIGLLPDIKRVWMYHGAEHKTINALEAGQRLTLANVRRHPLAHPRCGTSFIVTLVVISIIVFALLGRPPMVLRLASRLVLLPVIAGVGYEFIMFTARAQGNVLVRWIAAPGMWFQRLTTREPDDAQIEVAIAAMDHVLARENDLTELRPAHVAAVPFDDRSA